MQKSEAGITGLAFCLSVFRLQAHVADRVAPVTIAGRAANGAEPNAVGRAGRQIVERDRPGITEQSDVLERAKQAAGSNNRLTGD